MKEAREIFRKIVIDDNASLIYFNRDGFGVISRYASQILRYNGLRKGRKILVYFDALTFFPGSNVSGSDRIVTLTDYHNKRFYFKNHNLIRSFTNARFLDFYCGAFNSQNTRDEFKGEVLTRWEIYNVDHFTNNLITRKTHAEVQKERFTFNQKRVREILGITDQEYSAMIFETAFIYLDQLEVDRESINLLSKSSVWWPWWKNQYYLKDEEFINEYDNGLTNNIKYLSDYYFDKHANINVVPEKFIFDELWKLQKNNQEK